MTSWKSWSPALGDVVSVRVRTAGGERRHGMVVASGAYSARTGFTVVCPIAQEATGYPFEVALPGEWRVRGVILADRVMSLDTRSWGVRLVCSLPDEVVTAVCEKLATVIDLRRG
jgi:mRNA interferase MazF